MNLASLFDFSWVTNASAWIGLLTLVALEIVLGIDNIVFISILAGKLPADQQPKARKMGLVLAVIPRILLLLALPFVLRLTEPVLFLPFADPNEAGQKLGLSVQDLIVIVGGLFLLAKATHEIHGKLEGDEHTQAAGAGGKGGVTYSSVLVQIMLLNIVFSLDSIVTAIGMIPPEQVMVMVLSVLIATAVMAVAVNAVSAFVEKHPTVKMLALSFLLLIGTTLIIEGFHAHIPKGYVYFAMAFSVFVELLNIKVRKPKGVPSRPVVLREPRA
ncbi:MAG: TerC family protein [Cytophagales bacterium]|nr:TerC family protein [Armatimonadota bacterium]